MKKKDLFDLIKSLTPAEKKLVRQHAFTYKKDGDNILHQLFTAIDKQPKYDETTIKKKTSNLSNRKKELWEKIMIVLQMSEQTIAQVAARRKLDFAHILIKKQLFNQAELLAEEVNKWSSENEQPYFKGMALQYLTNIVQQTHNTHMHSQANSLQKELIKNAEEITLTIQAYDFYLRVAQLDSDTNFIRDIKIHQEAEKFLSDKFIDLPVQKMSLMTATMYTDAKSTIYYILRNYQASVAIENEMEKKFLAHPLNTLLHKTAYRNFLINRINPLDHTNEYTTWEKTLTAYKQLIDTSFPNDLLSKASYYVFAFWYHYRFDKFKTAPHFIQETENFYTQFRNPEIEKTFLLLQWNFVIAFFDLGDLDKAWLHCSQWINNTSNDVMPDVQEFMRLFFLFILLEKKEEAYLASRIKQYEKLIRTKNKSLYAFDMLVIAFIKKITKAKGRIEQRDSWRWLLEEINNLSKAQDIYTIEVLSTFDFREWIKRNKI